MKKILLGVLILLLASAGAVKAQQEPIKLFLSPASTIPSADIVKYLDTKCRNVSLTLDPKKSDYMLEAGGWSGHYRFTLFKKGGDAVFSTSTVMLSNAVKDVCRYMKAKK